jgi:D-sedoheptulose 7-phosphate isomerase
MSFAEAYLARAHEAIGSLDVARIEQAIQWFEEARAAGRQIFVFGNGGSAATASHFVTEMLKGASYNRASRFRILALTDSMATITAYSNDVSYDCVFAEQLKNFAAPGDLVMGLSSSGNSVNVIRAFEYANSIGCRTLALTGRGGGKLAPLAQLNIEVRAPHTGRVEDAHMVVCHIICYRFMEEAGA